MKKTLLILHILLISISIIINAQESVKSHQDRKLLGFFQNLKDKFEHKFGRGQRAQFNNAAAYVPFNGVNIPHIQAELDNVGPQTKAQSDQYHKQSIKNTCDQKGARDYVKDREPSWCDRIIIGMPNAAAASEFKVHAYGSISKDVDILKKSDHDLVYGLFEYDNAALILTVTFNIGELQTDDLQKNQWTDILRERIKKSSSIMKAKWNQIDIFCFTFQEVDSNFISYNKQHIQEVLALYGNFKMVDYQKGISMRDMKYYVGLLVFYRDDTIIAGTNFKDFRKGVTLQWKYNLAPTKTAVKMGPFIIKNGGEMIDFCGTHLPIETNQKKHPLMGNEKRLKALDKIRSQLASGYYPIIVAGDLNFRTIKNNGDEYEQFIKDVVYNDDNDYWVELQTPKFPCTCKHA